MREGNGYIPAKWVDVPPECKDAKRPWLGNTCARASHCMNFVDKVLHHPCKYKSRMVPE